MKDKVIYSGKAIRMILDFSFTSLSFLKLKFGWFTVLFLAILDSRWNFIHTDTYIHTYICIYTHMYKYTVTHAYIYIHTYIYFNIYMVLAIRN